MLLLVPLLLLTAIPAVANPVCVGAVMGGCGPSWTQHWSSAGMHDNAQALAGSPDGSRLYVASSGNSMLSMRALDAATGALVWSVPVGANLAARHLAVSPDGSRILLGTWNGLYLLSTANGATLTTVPVAADTAVLLSGTRAYAVGTVFNPAPAYGDYQASAIDVSSGAVLWTMTYDGGATSQQAYENARAATLVDSDRFLVVTGSSADAAYSYVGATLALNVANGQPVIVMRDSSVSSWTAAASAPGSDTFALGTNQAGAALVRSYFLDGTRSWERALSGATCCTSMAALASGGGRIYAVTSGPWGQGSTVVALGRGDGAVAWTTKVDANSLSKGALTRTGQFVALGTLSPLEGGRYADIGLFGIDDETGRLAWSARYDGAARSDDQATGFGVAPDGAAAYFSGTSRRADSGYDAIVAAYSTGLVNARPPLPLPTP